MEKASGSGLLDFSPFSSEFDPEALERGAKALREIAASKEAKKKDDAPEHVRNDNTRMTSSRFDPEALERGAQALREIGASKEAKKAFELMKKQKETSQTELAAKATEFKAMQAQSETERQRVIYDEQIKLAQQQAQIESQMVGYEDELARKRMQA